MTYSRSRDSIVSVQVRQRAPFAEMDRSRRAFRVTRRKVEQELLSVLDGGQAISTDADATNPADLRPASFDIAGPSPSMLPVLLSSPHSGEAFSDDFLAHVDLPPRALHPLGDGPLDRLYAEVCTEGVQLLSARYSRAVVDLNRAPDEIAPEQLLTPAAVQLRITEKVRLGLGVIPGRVNGRVIRRSRISCEDFRNRIDTIHAPYHTAIDRALASLVERFGHALLLDCHSMPSGLVSHGGRAVDVVLGDACGMSADPALVELARRCFADAGLFVRLNQPYAGGFITRRHGHPAMGRSALQIEIRRDLFMDESSRELRACGVRMARVMRDLVRRAGRMIAGGRRGEAAA